jgi:S-adenosylmethionine-diacylglycerol 3-amino-3-carboxypropyl transferase
MSKPVLTGGALERLVFGSGLVFNQTWEDPEVDKQALAPGENDVVFAIASAGDNVLACALAGPKKIYAVDLNPAQIYLLNLKIAAARQLSYADFWHLFSLAPAPRAHDLYHDLLRSHVDGETRLFWDANLGLLRAGLYRAGVFGRALWLLRTYLRVVCGPRALARVFECESLAEQAGFYFKRVHSRWWNPLAKPFAEQLPILLMFGAHPRQARRVGGRQFAGFLEAGIRRAMSTSPARDNFLWQQVLLGRYLTPPPYLRPENFARLREAVTRIETRVGRAEVFLRGVQPSSVTRFNLLDAPDWLSAEETVEWWDVLQKAAAPAARVLFRSIDPGYRLPESVLSRWENLADPAWAAQERTGVYAGVYLLCRRS